jgi:hypothetical protein
MFNCIVGQHHPLSFLHHLFHLSYEELAVLQCRLVWSALDGLEEASLVPGWCLEEDWGSLALESIEDSAGWMWECGNVAGEVDGGSKAAYHCVPTVVSQKQSSHTNLLT